MKKEYNTPSAERMNFDYTKSVVACAGSWTENVSGDNTDSGLVPADYNDSIQCPEGVSWRHVCPHDDPHWGCSGT